MAKLKSSANRSILEWAETVESSESSQQSGNSPSHYDSFLVIQKMLQMIIVSSSLVNLMVATTTLKTLQKMLLKDHQKMLM